MLSHRCLIILVQNVYIMLLLYSIITTKKVHHAYTIYVHVAVSENCGLLLTDITYYLILLHILKQQFPHPVIRV